MPRTASWVLEIRLAKFHAARSGKRGNQHAVVVDQSEPASCLHDYVRGLDVAVRDAMRAEVPGQVPKRRTQALQHICVIALPGHECGERFTFRPLHPDDRVGPILGGDPAGLELEVHEIGTPDRPQVIGYGFVANLQRVGRLVKTAEAVCLTVNDDLKSERKVAAVRDRMPGSVHAKRAPPQYRIVKRAAQVQLERVRVFRERCVRREYVGAWTAGHGIGR